jgi:hypothetical protein
LQHRVLHEIQCVIIISGGNLCHSECTTFNLGKKPIQCLGAIQSGNPPPQANLAGSFPNQFRFSTGHGARPSSYRSERIVAGAMMLLTIGPAMDLPAIGPGISIHVST